MGVNPGLTPSFRFFSMHSLAWGKPDSGGKSWITAALTLFGGVVA
jgi:hypothetical protein